MKNFTLIIVPIWSIVCLLSCAPRPRRKGETIQKINQTTGEATAVDHLIQKFEGEHQKLYEQEIGNGDYLQWPALDKKNLSNYCTKYVEHSLPGKQIKNAINGFKIIRVLHYRKGNMGTSRFIVTVCCKISNDPHSFYITRAPEPNCVYAMKCNKGAGRILNLIHKYCDFEKEISLKRKRAEIISKMHRSTGQPIAKDEYLLEYELEHQELFNKENDNCKHIEWPHAILHDHLDNFCYQYVGVCAPARKRNAIRGSWKNEKLYYQQLGASEEIGITVITCIQINHDERKIHYYLTRAIEKNCVYALLRKGFHYICSPLIIVFKHCDFENSNVQQITSHSDNMDVITKAEVKEEILDISETMQLFPQ